ERRGRKLPVDLRSGGAQGPGPARTRRDLQEEPEDAGRRPASRRAAPRGLAGAPAPRLTTYIERGIVLGMPKLRPRPDFLDELIAAAVGHRVEYRLASRPRAALRFNGGRGRR